MVILVAFYHFFVILKNGVFCEMVILVVFNSFNVVKNLKKPDLIARQKPPFYTTPLAGRKPLVSSPHQNFKGMSSYYQTLIQNPGKSREDPMGFQEAKPKSFLAF